MYPIPSPLTGTCSTFGGPHDSGMTSTEGVSLYNPQSADPYGLFLRPHGRRGRDLNPASMYCAMRWDYKAMTLTRLRASRVMVCNERNGKHVLCHPADWGPNARTGRIIDLSPGAAEALGVETDDVVTVIFFPSEE